MDFNYTASAALASALSALDLNGWKLPSRSDFDTLFANAGANGEERARNLNAEYPNTLDLTEKIGDDIFGFRSMFTGYMTISQNDGHTVNWTNVDTIANYNADASTWNGYFVQRNNILWNSPCHTFRLVKNL